MKNSEEIKRLLDLHLQTGDAKYWGEAIALIDPQEFAEECVLNPNMASMADTTSCYWGSV